MMSFWILAAGLTGLALLFVLVPLLRRSAGREDAPADEVDQDSANLMLFKQQLAELDEDLAAGKLDSDRYDAARRDAERELLYSVRDSDKASGKTTGGRAKAAPLTALVVLLLVPGVTWLLYADLGSQGIIERLQNSAMMAAIDGQTNQDQADITALVQRLEERLDKEPGNVEGWMILGRAYFSQGRTLDAEQALKRAYELMPRDVQIILGYAEAIAVNNDNSLEGRPAELISEAIAVDPNDATARWLAGMVSFQRGRYSAAAVSWRRALAQLDPQSQDAQDIAGLIEEAERRAGAPAQSQAAQSLAAQSVAAQSVAAQSQAIPATDSATEVRRDDAQNTGNDASVESTANPDSLGTESLAASSTRNEPVTTAEKTAEAPTSSLAPGIDLEVSLSPELADQTSPTAVVFVYAKAASGPPMPLAAQRLRVADLPVRLRLDDSMAMMPQMRLSAFPEVIVGARISRSGQATPQSGDLEGETGPMSSNPTAPVSVTIDRVRP